MISRMHGKACWNCRSLIAGAADSVLNKGYLPNRCQRQDAVHDPVDHPAQIDRRLVTPGFAGGDQRRQRPFVVGQITRRAQLAVVIAFAVLRRSAPDSQNQAAILEPQPILE
jgi:hypothetical protein